MRRFYKTAEVAPTNAGFQVSLDGKPVRTPAKAALVVPKHALAAGIAEEWQAQGETVDLASLRLTRLTSIALDLVAPRREQVIAEIAKYAGTEMVCYRAEAPPELVQRQHAIWQPLVDWVTLRFDAPLSLTTGVVPIVQPPTTLTALEAAIASYALFPLTALHFAVATAGSLVVGLALVERKLDAEAAFAAAELEQSFEIERWGEDAEQTKRRTELRTELGLVERFLKLLASD